MDRVWQLNSVFLAAAIRKNILTVLTRMMQLAATRSCILVGHHSDEVGLRISLFAGNVKKNVFN